MVQISFSIIQKSQLEGAHRLDAEYYQPEYLRTKDLLSRLDTSFLKDVASITTGPAYSSEAMGSDGGIPLARIGDVVNKTEVERWFRITRKEFEKFGNKKIKNLDILTSMTGDPPDVGKCNLISLKNGETTAFNQRVAKLSARTSPYYLFAYLSTDVARSQSERNALGIRQRNLGINDLRNILVYIPRSRGQVEAIDFIIEDYLLELQNSKSLYSQAENLLLEKLGLKDFKPEDVLYIVNLSDIKSAHRADAEYFQPKYKKLESRIKNYESRVSTPASRVLKDLVTIKKGFEPGSEAYQEEGKLFIRVSSLSKNGVENRDQKCLSDDLYKKLKKDFEPKVGEILLTKDATPGVAYVLKEPVEGVISGGILRLKVKENVEPEYIALCINSLVGQMQAERDAGGSVIAHWKPDQIKNLLIPILPQPTQQKIAALVRQSHAVRKKAKALLEEAKRKVEEMIEKSK